MVITAIIEIVSDAVLGFLSGDTRAHNFFALGTDDHATHEVGFDVITFVEMPSQLDELTVFFQFINHHEILDRKHGHEVIRCIQVDTTTSFAIHHYAGIRRITQNLLYFLLVHFVQRSGFILVPPLVSGMIHLFCNLIKRLTLQTQSEYILDNQKIISIRTKELVWIFVVSVLGFVDIFAFFYTTLITSSNVVTQLVRILFGEHKCNTKQHLATRLVFKGKADKFQIFDDAFVE